MIKEYSVPIAFCTGSSESYVFDTIQEISIMGFMDMMHYHRLTSYGIPMPFELAKVLGCEISEIRNQINQKKVTYNHIEKCLNNMTSEDGVFYLEGKLKEMAFASY